MWIVVDTAVYDLSKFADLHPGGAYALTQPMARPHTQLGLETEAIPVQLIDMREEHDSRVMIDDVLDSFLVKPDVHHLRRWRSVYPELSHERRVFKKVGPIRRAERPGEALKIIHVRSGFVASCTKEAYNDIILKLPRIRREESDKRDQIRDVVP